MKKIVFDIETRNIFSEVGSNNPADLDMSVICLYDSETDKYQSFLVEELGKLWPIIERADLLIGFNQDHFDIPILNKYYSGDLTKIKSLDILKEVKKSLGRRIKLDTLAEATLGKKKIGHGLDAIKWWREGKIDEIKKYCLEDVRITKEIYDYAIKNNHLKYFDMGKIKEITLNTKDWENVTKENPKINFTLPF